LLSDLRFVSRFDAQLLIAIKPDVFSALDNNRANAKCRTDSGADGCADWTAGNCADNQTGSGRRADFNRIAFHRAFALDRAFGVHASDIIAFDR
jgi:hypothetical protein